MDIEVYCDESHQELFRSPQDDPNGHVVLGSLWIRAEDRDHHKEWIRELRHQHDVHGEFKWGKVSPSRTDFYLELVRGFFREPEMRFRALVLRASQLDAARFHGADNELMFHKFYYLMLHHWVYDFNRYSIFIDAKTNRVHDRLATLKRVLNNANISSEITNVQALPSDEVDLIQLSDLLLGAVAAKYNGGRRGPAKTAVLQEVERSLRQPIGPTPRAADKFNVFYFRPGGGW